MESVFAQDYEPVEIVVLDDGSTDETPVLMAGYGERIRYYWQENQGIAQTRTNGCKLAKGEYIAFQDDDDLMPPDRITVLYEALNQHPSGVLAVGDWEAIDEDGNPTGHRWLPERSTKLQDPILFHDGYKAILWPEVPAAPHTTLFRKSDGEKIGWFDTRFVKASEDKDFFARLGQLGPIVYVPKVVSYYRRGHTSLTSKRLDVPFKQYLLFEKHLASLNHRRPDLKERLQYRLLLALTKIAMHRDTRFMLPSYLPDDYLKKGLSLVGYKNRVKYHWSALIKYPMRNLVRKFSRN
jgi:glycosyltransferase involved in cell wall biosynthesis